MQGTVEIKMEVGIEGGIVAGLMRAGRGWDT